MQKDRKGDMKVRLIDADALKEVLCLDDLIQLKTGIDGRIIDKLIDSTPTVDAVPVVHGEWKEVGDYHKRYECSICGAQVPYVMGGINAFCGNCGASMDGERREKNDKA